MAIKGGYIGKLLRVDLTNRKTWEEELKEEDLKKYFGQMGIGVKIMYEEVPP